MRIKQGTLDRGSALLHNLVSDVASDKVLYWQRQEGTTAVHLGVLEEGQSRVRTWAECLEKIKETSVPRAE